MFDDVDITTGAAKLTVEALSASSLKLNLGAGDARFENLNASSDAEIKGGAGQISVVNGTLNNLTIKMGVGELNLCAALLGNNDLEFGVGKSDITLIGSRDTYRVEIEKGLGSITVDGKNVSDFGSSGNGQNHIKIKGGVGSVNLTFQGE